LPTMPFLTLSALFAVAAKVIGTRVKNADKADKEAESHVEEASEEETKEITNADLFVMDSLELELGYGLLSLVDEKRGGDLLQRITNIRKQISSELGIVVHPVRVRDNLQLESNSYAIRLKGVEIVRAELMANKLLAMSGPEGADGFEGITTVEPAFNLPAIWIDEDRKMAAEMEGYTVVEPNAVLATHLSEIIRSHSDELLTRQDVKELCESVREFAPALIEDLIPDKVNINTLHNTLRALLHERIPIKDIVTILESLANYAGTAISQDGQMEKVREALSRTISSMFVEPDGNLYAISLHPEVEQVLLQSSSDSDKIGAVVLNPGFAQQFLQKLEQSLQQSYSRGIPPVLLVPTPIRLFVKRLVEPTFPALPVMGYTEITANTKVQSAGTVVFEGAENAQQA